MANNKLLVLAVVAAIVIAFASESRPEVCSWDDPVEGVAFKASVDSDLEIKAEAVTLADCQAACLADSCPAFTFNQNNNTCTAVVTFGFSVSSVASPGAVAYFLNCSGLSQCAGTPCMNAATCYMDNGNPACFCIFGWQGELCSEPDDRLDISEFVCPRTTYADIVFIIDSSGSIGPVHFTKILDFIVALVSRLDIGSSLTRVGIMSYDSRIYLEFNLNEHSSLTALTAAIAAIEYQAGATSTHLALRYAREFMFTIGNGDRPDAPNILIVITDGLSNEPALTQSEAALFHAQDVMIFCIGIAVADATEVNGIASDPDDIYAMTVADFDALLTINNTILETVCNVSKAILAKTCSGLHIDCNNGSDPNSLAYSKCGTDNTCICVDGYFHHNPLHSCVPILLGTPCSHEASPDAFCEAGIPHSKCGASDECECDICTGYHFAINSWGQQYCKHFEPGSNCSTNADCESGMADGTCTDGECECPAGMVFVYSAEACITPSSDAACSTCTLSGGVCYDSNSDSSPDTCACPPHKQSTDPSDFTVGCDVSLVDPGKLCDSEGVQSVCRSPNAQCNHAKAVSEHHQCQCKLTYQAVPERYNPDYNAKCVKAISKFTDPNCKWCTKRGGVCVDKDGDYLRDDCMCPETRSTSSHAHPKFDCDTDHVNVTCLKDSMKITYLPQNKAKYLTLLSELQSDEGSVFIRHKQDTGECWFNLVDGLYELTLSLQDEMLEMCDVMKMELPDASTTYSTEVRIQRGKTGQSILAWIDFTFSAYCTYYNIVGTDAGEGGVTVKEDVGTQSASEGTTVAAEIEISVRDEFGQNAEESGLTAGDNVQLIIEMTNDADAYVKIRVETCIAADRPNLDDPAVQTELLVDGGCPIGSSDPTFELDPTDPNLALSEYFPSVSFEGSSYIYFHCAIRVCRQRSECPENSCYRKRRSLSGRIRSYSDILEVSEYDWGVKSGASTGGIYIRPKGYVEDQSNSYFDEDFKNNKKPCPGMLGICGLNLTIFVTIIAGFSVTTTLTVTATILYRLRKRKQENMRFSMTSKPRVSATSPEMLCAQAQIHSPVRSWWYPYGSRV